TGEPGQQVVGELVGEVAQFDVHQLRLLQRLDRGRAETLGQQPRAGGVRQAGRDDDDPGHAGTSASSARWPVAESAGAYTVASTAPPARSTRERWVGASGMWAGRPSAKPLRISGRISPSRSSCSSTVFNGRPAWSIRNNWRW